MNHSALKCLSVEDYIKGFPGEVQVLLEEIRKTILEKAPQTVEGIAYGTPSGHNAFSKELSGYRQGKGSVQFTLDKPIPYALIGRMVQFRVKELTKPKAPPKAKGKTK